MISAVDTNVLLDVLRPNLEFLDASLGIVTRCGREGKLVICAVVYAELCAHFPNQRSCDQFLRDRRIAVQPFSRAGCDRAARAWRAYRTVGGRRERILPDFLIGGHAAVQADRLISRDRGFYRSYFPTLAVIDPTSAAAP